MAQYLSPGVVPDASMFTELIRLVTANGLAIPGELATAFRALAGIEGTLRLLSPTFNILEQSRSFAHTPVRQTLRPESFNVAISEELQRCCRSCVGCRDTSTRFPERCNRADSVFGCGCWPILATATRSPGS